LKPERASLTIVAVVVAVAALSVPAAEALNRTPALSPTTRLLQVQLHSTRATLARAASEIARIRAGTAVGTVQQQLSQLQRTVNQATVQLGIAAAQSGELRARIDAIPSPLAVAVEQVRREVAYARGGLAQYPRGQLISEAAMDYVAGHVSDTAFGYLEKVHGRLPRDTANSALRTQAGICAEASVTFATMVHRFGFAVRSVDFNYVDPAPTDAPDGHTAVEVYYSGGWHYYDPTYGLFWTDPQGDVLSIAAVRAGQGTLQKNVASFTNIFETAVLGDDTWFETAPTTAVVIGTTKLIRK
jgi:transglutaminase superfamily protein